MSAIDISYWQNYPDFGQVRNSSTTLVILKCGGGEGGSFYRDSRYIRNRDTARAVGLAVGSYFFNGPVNPTAAADFQFSIIDWRAGDIVAIDVENNGSQPPWNPAQVLAWCQRMIAHGVPANRLLVYMSSSLLGAGWGAVAALGTGLWVAQYGPNDGNAHSIPGSGPWGSWALWQYTSVGTVPGIVGYVDMNQISPSFASSSETILISTKPIGAETMRVIRSASGTIATITDSAGAKVWALAQITRAAAEAKVFNPTADYITVTDDELTVLIDEANFRKIVIPVAAPVIAPVVAPVAPAPMTDADVLRIANAIKALLPQPPAAMSLPDLAAAVAKATLDAQAQRLIS